MRRLVEALLDSTVGQGDAWLVAVNDTFLAPVGAVASRLCDGWSVQLSKQL
jgi:hypothetical protein